MRKSLIWLLWLFSVSAALAVQVTFTYIPPSGLVLRSVVIRGSMNNWGQAPMVRAGGHWSVVMGLKPGVYAYKYFISGQWPKDMCSGGHFGAKLSPEPQGCQEDGYGGRNALIPVAIPQTPAKTPPSPLDLSFDPAPAADVSVAREALWLRFSAARGSLKAARAVVGPKHFDFFHQLDAGGHGYWMAALPPGAHGVRLDLTLADGTVVLAGPFDLPGKVFYRGELGGARRVLRDFS